MKWSIKFIAERPSLLDRRIGLKCGIVSESGVDLAQPLVFKRAEEGQFDSAPFLSLRPEEAQALMDVLWDCGLRPSEGTGSAGSLRAVERHLEDMRALVFKLPARDIAK